MTKPMRDEDCRIHELGFLIERLPNLDLTWPAELQAMWWESFCCLRLKVYGHHVIRRTWWKRLLALANPGDG